MTHSPTRTDLERISAGPPWTDEQRWHWLARSQAICHCGHERARHCGNAVHDESCDEDGCKCVAFTNLMEPPP